MSREREHVQFQRQIQARVQKRQPFKAGASAHISPPHATPPHDPPRQRPRTQYQDIAHVHSHLKILCLHCLCGQHLRAQSLRIRPSRQVARSRPTTVHQETRRISHHTQTQARFRSLSAIQPRTCAITRPWLDFESIHFMIVMPC